MTPELKLVFVIVGTTALLVVVSCYCYSAYKGADKQLARAGMDMTRRKNAQQRLHRYCRLSKLSSLLSLMPIAFGLVEISSHWSYVTIAAIPAVVGVGILWLLGTHAWSFSLDHLLSKDVTVKGLCAIAFIGFVVMTIGLVVASIMSNSEVREAWFDQLWKKVLGQ